MLNVLLSLIRASVRSQMQYRASFILWSVGNFSSVGVELLGLWALFARFGDLPGWTLAQVAVLYGIVILAFALAEMAGRGFDQFASLVRSGDFDRFLLRPQPTALLLAGQIFELSRVGRLLAGGEGRAARAGRVDRRTGRTRGRPGHPSRPAPGAHHRSSRRDGVGGSGGAR